MLAMASLVSMVCTSGGICLKNSIALSRYIGSALSSRVLKRGLPNQPLQSDERLRRSVEGWLVPRRRGLRRHLLAAVLRSGRPFGVRR